MAYKALKPCSFAGQKFKIGEIVPDSVLVPGAITRLILAGKIAESAEGPLLPSAASLETEETDSVQAEENKEMIAGHLDAEQLEEMSYNDLKAMAKEMGLSTKGTKDELIARIAAAEVMVPAEEGEKEVGEQ